MKKHDISKLPKWAEQEINSLRANVEYWKGMVTSCEKGETNIYAEVAHVGEAAPIYLPDRTSIYFRFGKHSHINVWMRDGWITVNGSIGSGILVKPDASNQIMIRPEREVR